MIPPVKFVFTLHGSQLLSVPQVQSSFLSAPVHISTADTLLSVQSCSITSIQSGTSPSIVQENEAGEEKQGSRDGKATVQNNILGQRAKMKHFEARWVRRKISIFLHLPFISKLTWDILNVFNVTL